MSKTETKYDEPAYLDSLMVGDLVEHPKWGIGSILARSGGGERTKLVVAFPEAEGNGQKKLMAKFARLRKIEDIKPVPEKVAPVVEEPVVEPKVEPPAQAVAAAEEEEELEDDEDELLPLEMEDDDEEDIPARGKRDKEWEEGGGE